jgi:calcineurin-like phosphoesterase
MSGINAKSFPISGGTKNCCDPLNFPDGTRRATWHVRQDTKDGQKIAVINAMAPPVHGCDRRSVSPRLMNVLVEKEKMGINASAIFVDFHGEATSKNIAGAVSGWPRQVGRRHAHARPNSGRTDHARRHGVS